MTQLDDALDVSALFRDRPVTLYRLAREKYAHLSGEGAARMRGRWNRKRQEAIYTSHQLAATLLERLVHTAKNRIPIDLKLLRIQVDGAWMATGNQLFDRRTGASFVALPTLRQAAEAYSIRGRAHPARKAFAVALPSVIAPVWNVVLYPQRHGFWEHVALESVEPFSYDPRLFAADAVLEERDA